MDPSQPAHPRHVYFKERLESFSSWPPQINPKSEIAHAGLFYTNTVDKVICFACGLLICSWKQDDDPWLDHYQHTSDCQYLNIVGALDCGLCHKRAPEVQREISIRRRMERFNLHQGAASKAIMNQMCDTLNCTQPSVNSCFTNVEHDCDFISLN